MSNTLKSGAGCRGQVCGGLGTLCLSLGMGFGLAKVEAQSTSPTLDVKPAFMQVITNVVFRTNAVVVTNYVVTTNVTWVTNLYNAQGILLQPVVAAPAAASAATPSPAPAAAPDPAVVKAKQLQAVRDLLMQGLVAASNQVAWAGAFTTNLQQQIQIPQGVTSFDRKKSASLISAMNLTAEKAAPAVMGLLMKAAGEFQPADPAAVVKGAPDAATRGFVASFQGGLDGQLVALVQQAGVETRLRETYSNVMLKGGGLLGAVLGSGPSVDIESHVAQSLLQTVVQKVAATEEKIRKEPSSRNTPALKESLP